MVARNATLVAATVAMGLAAGLFYTFACAVMPGLRHVDDRTFIDAMQRINVAILNGWFALSFGGAFLLAALAAFLEYRAGSRSTLLWVGAATALYTCVLLMTFAINVPLNDALERAGDPARITDLAGVRAKFESSWVAWNVARAVFSTGALACLSWALLLRGRR
jgi:uncharacterized membrane protein